MITALGDWLARKLTLSGAVPEEERELYSYGFFLLLSRGLFLAVTAAFGAMWGVLWESVAFYALFSLLRGYAGGIHASGESACQLWTTAAMLLSTGLIRWLEDHGREAVALGLLLAGLTGVALLSPLDAPEKPLAPEDRSLYRRRSLAAALGAAGGSLASAALGWPAPLAIAAPALALEALLLAIGTVKARKSAKTQESSALRHMLLKKGENLLCSEHPSTENSVFPRGTPPDQRNQQALDFQNSARLKIRKSKPQAVSDKGQRMRAINRKGKTYILKRSNALSERRKQ